MVRQGNSFPFGFRSTETTHNRGHLAFPPKFSGQHDTDKRDTRNWTESNVQQHGIVEEREPQQDLQNEAARFGSEQSPLSIAGQGSPFDEEKRESEQVAKKTENASFVLANTKSAPPSNFRYASTENDYSIEIEAKALVADADRTRKHKQPAEASKNITKYYFEITPSQLDGVTVTRKHARGNDINVFAYVRIAGQGSESCNPPVECSSATLLEDERGKMIRKQMGIFWSPAQDPATKRGTLSVQVDRKSLERIALEIGIHSDDHYQKFVSMLLDIKAIQQQTKHVKLKFQLPGAERRTNLFSRRKSPKVHIGSVQCHLMNDLVLHATCRIREEIDLSASSMTNNPFHPREHISDSVSPQPIDIKGVIDSIVSKPRGKEPLQASTERNSVENEVGISADHHSHVHTQRIKQSLAQEVSSLNTPAIAEDMVVEDTKPNIIPPGTLTTSKIQLSELDRTNISEDGKDQGKISCLSDVNPNSVDSQYPLKKADADKSVSIKVPRKFRKFELSNFTFDEAISWMQRQYSKLKESVPTSISNIPIIGDTEKKASTNVPRRSRNVELANFSFDDVTELISSSIPIFDKDYEDSISVEYSMSVEYNQMKRYTDQKKESESLVSVKTKDTERRAKREKRHRRVQDLIDTTSDSFSVHSETSQRAKHDIDYICGCIPNDFHDIFTNLSSDAESAGVHSEHDSETIEVPVEKEVPEEVISDLLENLLASMDGESVTTKDLKITAKMLNMTPGDLFEIIEAAEKKAQEN
jgi:hypothetical protein